MERFSTLFGKSVQFLYTALDRVVLNGYIVRLQQEADVVHFFHEVAKEECIEPEVLSARTNRYRAWVRTYAEEHGVAVVESPKRARKEDLVLPYYERLGAKEGVACVLTSMELGGTFVSYRPQRSRGQESNYRRIGRCRKRFLHYYFYVWDEIAGPMSLRVATYLPFNLTFYLNGHSFLARELERVGVKFRKEDNAILAVANTGALEEAAAKLTPELLQERCDYWVRRLVPVFSDEERAGMNLSHRYSVAQLEVATDVVFKRGIALKAMFGRAVELGFLLGGASRATQLFGRRITRQFKGKLQTVLERRDEGHPVLRSYYRSSFVKQYEKAERLLRTETCVNNTYDLDVGRLLPNLPELVERMKKTNGRYLDAQAELLDSTVDTGSLAELARPVEVGKRRVPGIKLHDERLIRLLDAILDPGGLLADWTTRDVHKRVLQRARLTADEYSLTQLRYDLGKLRAHKLVERIGKTRRYRLTVRGLRLGTLLVKVRTRFLGPLCAQALATQPKRSRHPSPIEAAFRQVDRSLDELCKALGLAA